MAPDSLVGYFVCGASDEVGTIVEDESTSCCANVVDGCKIGRANDCCALGEASWVSLDVSAESYG